MKAIGKRKVKLNASLFANWQVYKDTKDGTYWVRYYDNYLKVFQVDGEEKERDGWRMTLVER